MPFLAVIRFLYSLDYALEGNIASFFSGEKKKLEIFFILDIILL